MFSIIKQYDILKRFLKSFIHGKHHISLRSCLFYLSGHYDVADLLLERNANRDCRTKTGITPLFQVLNLLQVLSFI